MRRVLWPILLGSALVVPACAADDPAPLADEPEPEPETVPARGDEVIDCHAVRMMAFDHGESYPIDVITIGAKRTSRAAGHAFLKMKAAADEAGVTLTLNSGFRTNDEQRYFYHCYQTKECNDGNLAAKPGYSNHQNGRALDVSTSKWLKENAGSFGFRRTVPSEPWHYEYDGDDPGGPCSDGETR